MNFILNDSIYLLDEVIAKLPKIREVEQAMQDLGAWNAQDAVRYYFSPYPSYNNG
jgi:hypothetical protein